MEHIVESSFAFINSTINVLIVDCDNDSVKKLIHLFLRMPIYTVQTVTSAAAAVLCFQNNKRIHVCIMEFGLADVENNEFYLLEHYSEKTAFIVLTESKSPSKGAQSIQAGAKRVFEKNRDTDFKAFIQYVSYAALMNIVNPQYREHGLTTLDYATEILFTKYPESVTQWAEYLKITDRQLRNIWQKGVGLGAKQVLALFTIINAACRGYLISIFDTPEALKNYTATIIGCNRLHSYFVMHQERISSIVQ